MSDELATLRCIDCRYELRGLTENRCPECGRVFDPHDPFTTYTPVVRQRLRLVAWLPGFVLATTFLAGFFLFIFLGRRGGILDQTTYVLSLEIFLWFAWFARWCVRRAILWPIVVPPRIGMRRLGRALLILTSLYIAVRGYGGIAEWSCPHGDSMRVGPFVLTRNSDNGPCGNYCDVRSNWKIGRETFISFAPDL